MAADPMSQHYPSLTPPERFALVVEALARRDMAEADRLEDACPRFMYRTEDAEYRDRMRRSFAIAAMACLNMRGGLAQLRLAAAFSSVCREFADAPARLAAVAFLYGRGYGHWEAGAVESVDVPEREALAAELAANAFLKEQLADLRDVAGEVMQTMADALRHATGEAHAADLLAQWEGFGRFCRESLGVEPMTLLAAFRLGDIDPAADVMGSYPDARADEAEAARWAGDWARVWGSRFGAKG